MFTLEEIAAATARLDGTPDTAFAALLKGFRNLSQRVPVYPADTRARAGLYGEQEACVLRMAQILTAAGLDRTDLGHFCAWLQVAPAGRTMQVPVPGGLRGMSRTEEAVTRAREGQDFTFTRVLRATGNDWQADWPGLKSPLPDDVFPEPAPELARLVLPASRLIRDLLAELGA